ncbi:extracellular solute-binding protein [Salinibacterium sp. SYSU T00001]|uniref:ABC transporter substrate-binding protein n=1 Tax=Homoserinimonas sedimenticola TaxID=2986805 RepID=UPI002236350F|nr:extracellular solute-binding protein [Salinibacterium sedimenticola]MCW4385898.1 extracellular solute-binding protein [Salinibacterium sedimenticola]
MTQHRHTALRRGAFIAIPVAGALVLAGCSGSGDEGDSGSTGFSFTYATSNNLESPYEALANAYMEANPGVDIELNPQPNDNYDTTVRTQLQAGNATDIIQTVPGAGQPRSVVELAEAGFLAPLGDASAAIISEGTENLFQVDGETYGQPVDFTVTGIVANLTTAQDAGVDEFPDDFNAFLDACADVAASGKSMVALAGAAAPNTGLMAMSISATRVYAETPDWNEQRAAGDTTFAESEGWQDTLQTVIDMHEAGCFQPGAEGGGFDAITNGLAGGTSIAAFAPGGSAVEIAQAAPEGVQFMIEPFPADNSDAFILASSNYSLSITEGSENQEAAQDFLDWVAGAEGAQIFADASGQLPVKGYEELELEGTVYESSAELLTSGAYAPLPNTIWPNASVYDALASGVQGLLTGQNTIDDVLSAMDAAWG